MPKKLVEEPVSVKSIQDVEALSKTHNRSQKIIFNCTICGELTISSMYKHHGGLREDLICYKCKRKNTMLEKFGSESITTTDYFKDKSKKTKIEKYGNPLYNNPSKQKETMTERYGGCGFASVELLNKQQATMQEKYGIVNAMESKDIIKSMRKRYTYDGKKFDSTWEIAFYIYLIDHKILFEYQPDVDFFYEYNNKRYRYLPDFKIGNDFYEIKGDQFFNDDGTMKCPFHPEDNDKFNAKCNFAKSIGVKFLRYGDVKKYLDYVTQTYGGKYLKSFKNY